MLFIVLVVVLNGLQEEVLSFCLQDNQLSCLADNKWVIRMDQLMEDTVKSMVDQLPTFFSQGMLPTTKKGLKNYLRKDFFMTIMKASVLVAMILVVRRYMENVNQITDAKKIADSSKQQANEYQRQADEKKHLFQVEKLKSICSL